MKKSKVGDLILKIKKCRKCELWKLRKNVVVGEGSLNSEIMLIGEAPGSKEDETGRPFVGRSGRLLNKLLEENGIKRERVYITSVLKCKGKPLKKYIKECLPYLEEQIKIINPKIIVLLGRVARDNVKKEWLLNKKVIKTCHPAAALRFKKYLEKLKIDLRKLKAYKKWKEK